MMARAGAVCCACKVTVLMSIKAHPMNKPANIRIISREECVSFNETDRWKQLKRTCSKQNKRRVVTPPPLDMQSAGRMVKCMSTPPQGEHDVTIEKVTQRAQDIEGKLPKLKQFFEQAKIMLSMVKDYWNGSYREVPYWAISAVALALLYVLNPADVLPDMLIGVGYLDDATVVAFCVKLVQREIERYQEWSAQRTQAGRGGKVVDVS